MSAVTKKPLTKKDIAITIKGKKIALPPIETFFSVQ